VPKSDAKQQPTVTLHIKTGPVTPAQRKAWQCLWQKLSAHVKSETGK